MAEDGLPETWMAVSGELQSRLGRELVAEVPLSHRLYGQRAIATAKCAGCDDVIFRLDSGWALVHLTWTQRAEQLPWPTTFVTETWREIVRLAHGRAH